MLGFSVFNIFPNSSLEKNKKKEKNANNCLMF